MGASVEEMSHYDQAVGKMGGNFLNSDWYCKVQLIVGGAIPGQIVLDSVRLQAEQAIGNKSISSPCLQVPALTAFDKRWKCVCVCVFMSEINPLLPQVAFVYGVS